MELQAFAELNARGDRVCVYFQYSLVTKEAVKAVPGSRFVPPEKGGPHWTVPLDLVTMRNLRTNIGNGLQLGDGLRAWGKAAVAKERELHSMAVADDVPVEELLIYKKLPALAQWFRPYQRADVKFLSSTSAVNMLQPRLGKTTETIGAIYEAGLEAGHHLVIAPQKSLDSVWRMEWERWTEMPVITWSGETSGTDRAKAWTQMDKWVDAGEPFCLCTTADMIRRGLPEDIESHIVWSSMTIDEFHKTGLPETKNKFPKKANLLKLIEGGRKYALSGTPISGKPIKLWGALHWLDKNAWHAKWPWAEQWLSITAGYQNHKKIGGIRPDRQDAFYEAHAHVLLRRTREEVLPELPSKQFIDVECLMTSTQANQYRVFAADTEIRIDEYHLSATSILAEYTRLKQFANARQEVEILGMDEDTGHVEMKLKPTFDSGKLPHLLELLAEAGIDPEDPAGETQAIVASQFREEVEMISRYLTTKGIKNIMITGKVNKQTSELAQKVFKAGNDSEGYRVCCMVTTMGVGITMDNVTDVFIMDETWVPDDQEQLTDRAINTTRNHQVNVFVLRSRGTIEQYIQDINVWKGNVNREVLDEWRSSFKLARKEVVRS